VFCGTLSLPVFACARRLSASVSVPVPVSVSVSVSVFVCVSVCMSTYVYVSIFPESKHIFVHTQELENDQQLSELMSDESFSKMDPISLAQVPLLMKP
jgi:hypothetical protein